MSNQDIADEASSTHEVLDDGDPSVIGGSSSEVGESSPIINPTGTFEVNDRVPASEKQGPQPKARAASRVTLCQPYLRTIAWQMRNIN